MLLNNGCSNIVLIINAKSHITINVARHGVDQYESGKAKSARDKNWVFIRIIIIDHKK